jgi:hypothetical protein
LTPAYIEAAETTRQVRFLRIEQANAASIIRSRSDIKGFPWIFGIKPDGTVVPYGERESRTSAALSSFASKLLEGQSSSSVSFPSNTNAQQQSLPVIEIVSDQDDKQSMATSDKDAQKEIINTTLSRAIAPSSDLLSPSAELEVPSMPLVEDTEQAFLRKMESN